MLKPPKPTLYLIQFLAFLILTLTGSIALSSDESRYGPVSNNENLWNISTQVNPDDSLITAQVVVSIFRRNPQAFINNNLNGLMQGQILIIPSPTKMQSISKQTAENILMQHWENWKNGITQDAPLESAPISPLIENSPVTDDKTNMPVISSSENHRLPELTETLADPQDEVSNNEAHEVISKQAVKTNVPVISSSENHLLPELTETLADPRAEASNHEMVAKQAVKTNQPSINKTDYLDDLFSQLQAQVIKYRLYIAGFVSILLISYLFFHKEQTFTRVKLSTEPEPSDKDQQDTSESNDIGEKIVKKIIVEVDSNTQKVNFATPVGITVKNDHPNKHEKSPSSLKSTFDELARQAHINNHINKLAAKNVKLTRDHPELDAINEEEKLTLLQDESKEAISENIKLTRDHPPLDAINEEEKLAWLQNESKEAISENIKLNKDYPELDSINEEEMLGLLKDELEEAISENVKLTRDHLELDAINEEEKLALLRDELEEAISENAKLNQDHPELDSINEEEILALLKSKDRSSDSDQRNN